jgi:pyruvate decarboxylase
VVKENWAITEVKELLTLSKLPWFTTAMGKGAVEESLPSFGGVYSGVGTEPITRKIVESSDVILWLGRFDVWVS